MNQTIDLLKEIIAIHSYVDETHNEKKLADYIFAKLSQNKSLKIGKQIVEGDRYNIIATDSEPEIILFGHMDTVLPKQQEQDPFQPIEKDGKIFGLGSADMKSGLSIILNIALNHHDPKVGYVFSVDEEFDFKGATKLKEITTLHPKYILNLEPTSNQIINGCRGITEFEFEIFGKSAHAGRKSEGINAIEQTVKLIEKFEIECRKNDQPGATSSVNLAYLHGGLKSDSTEDIKRMGNVVPNFAKAVVEIRIANQTITKEYIETSLESISKTVGIEIKNLKFKFYLGSMLTSKTELSLFEKAFTANDLIPAYADINLAGYYELQMLQSEWGGHGIIFGASPIELSHAANEYVEIDSVLNAEKVIFSFIKSL